MAILDLNKPASWLRGLADKLAHPPAVPEAPPAATETPEQAATGDRIEAALKELGTTHLPPHTDTTRQSEEAPPMSTAAVVTPLAPAPPAPVPVKSGFSFHSPAHLLATGLHDAYIGIKAVETLIEKVDTPANQALVESLSSLIPQYGPEAVTVERGVFAIGGQVAAILAEVDGGKQKLLDAGFDAGIIADFEGLIASVPGLVKPTPPKVG